MRHLGANQHQLYINGDQVLELPFRSRGRSYGELLHKATNKRIGECKAGSLFGRKVPPQLAALYPYGCS